jgi:hypothetical protein
MFVLVLGRSRSGLTPVWITKVIERTVSGGYGGGDIPVPIPNTAVKPTSADGTWGSPPGRVGRRRDFLKGPHFGGGLSLSHVQNDDVAKSFFRFS